MFCGIQHRFVFACFKDIVSCDEKKKKTLYNLQEAKMECTWVRNSEENKINRLDNEITKN